MLKWIFGCIVLVVGLAVWRGYAKYKDFTAGGDAASVMIAASPERVFASLANADSLSTWMIGTGSVHTERTGALEVGDELKIETKSSGRSRLASFAWTVTEIRSGQLVALEMRNDSLPGPLAVRRDSLVIVGDSTKVISTISSGLIDSLRKAKGDTAGKTRNMVADFSNKLLIAAFRTQSDAELNRLKARIEAKPKSVERDR